MSQFDFTLTVKGVLLLSKAQTGIDLNFSRCAFGDGILPSGVNLAYLTELINEVQSTDIKSITIEGNNAIISTLLTNDGLNDGYRVREIGLFAIDPDDGEILYAVGNAGSKYDYLPKYESNAVIEFPYDIIAIVGPNANISATLDPSSLDNHIEKKVYDNGGAHGFETSKKPGEDENNNIICWNNEVKKHEYNPHLINKVFDDNGVHGFISDQPDESFDGQFLKYDHTQRKHTYASAVNIVILQGEIAHGGTIPLPEGFTQNQCKWFVSLKSVVFHRPGWGDTDDSHEIYANTNRVVTVRSKVSGYGDWVSGVANYLIIGVK